MCSVPGVLFYHLRVNVAQGDSNCVPVENTRRVGLCLRCVRKYMLKHVICDVVVVNVEGTQPPETLTAQTLNCCR